MFLSFPWENKVVECVLLRTHNIIAAEIHIPEVHHLIKGEERIPLILQFVEHHFHSNKKENTPLKIFLERYQMIKKDFLFLLLSVFIKR